MSETIKPDLSGVPSSFVATAWVATALVSSLSDMLCYGLVHSVPPWWGWVKIALLGGLLLLTWLWERVKPLRPFLVILLAIALLTQASIRLMNWPVWTRWQAQQSRTVAAVALQTVEMGAASLFVGLLFLLRKRRQGFFLVKGHLQASSGPSEGFGERGPRPLFWFALLAALVLGIQYVGFIGSNWALARMAARVQQLLPLILLLAASKAFNEEIIFGAAPISTAYEVVGESSAIWMAAVLFGFSGYTGPTPPGVFGAVLTTYLGWFYGKCMVDSKGFLWPWLLHSLLGVVPFVLLAQRSLLPPAPLLMSTVGRIGGSGAGMFDMPILGIFVGVPVAVFIARRAASRGSKDLGTAAGFLALLTIYAWGWIALEWNQLPWLSQFGSSAGLRNQWGGFYTTLWIISGAIAIVVFLIRRARD